MAMAPPRLLRGLIAPLSLSPCHQQVLTSAALLHRWWLARLRCSDGFKLFLVVLLVSSAFAEVRYVASSSMAPTLRPGDRAVAEKVSYMFRRPSVGDIVFFRVPTALQVRQGQLIVNGVAQMDIATMTSSYTMEAMRLPQGHVFAMGDNRNNSCDSRAWLSLIEKLATAAKFSC